MDNITPGDILEIAESNHIVDVALMGWRNGVISWEQALMQAVVHLARRVNHLASSAPPQLNLTLSPLDKTQKAAVEDFMAARREQCRLDPDEPQGLHGLKGVHFAGLSAPAIENRIAYFREHGRWPEQANTIPRPS